MHRAPQTRLLHRQWVIATFIETFCILSCCYLDYTSAIHPLPVIKSDHGLHLKALVDIEKDEAGTRRRAGDEWQLRGPITYVPRPEVVRMCVCGDWGYMEVLCAE